MSDKLKEIISLIVLWGFIIFGLFVLFVLPILIAESDLSPWLKYWLLK